MPLTIEEEERVEKWFKTHLAIGGFVGLIYWSYRHFVQPKASLPAMIGLYAACGLVAIIMVGMTNRSRPGYGLPRPPVLIRMIQPALAIVLQLVIFALSQLILTMIVWICGFTSQTAIKTGGFILQLGHRALGLG